MYTNSDVKGISETIQKLYNGTYKEYPTLDQLLDENKWEHAAQLMYTIIEQVRNVENNAAGLELRKNVAMRLIQDFMKVCIHCNLNLKSNKNKIIESQI